MAQVSKKNQTHTTNGYSRRLLSVETTLNNMVKKIAKIQMAAEAKAAKLQAETLQIRKEAEDIEKRRKEEAAAEAKKRKEEAAAEAKKRKEEAAAEAKKRKEEKAAEAAEAAETKRRQAEEAAEAKKRQAEEAAEAKKRSDELDRKIDHLVGGISAKLAALTESLVSRFLIPLLKKRNIDVDHVARNLEGTYKGGVYKGRNWEVDNMAVNGRDVVVGEVKSHLRTTHVRRFIKRSLNQFNYMMPEYKDKNIYGSMAALRVDAKALELANEYGLLVIKLTSGSAEVLNDKSFKPKSYAISEK